MFKVFFINKLEGIFKLIFLIYIDYKVIDNELDIDRY